MAALPFRSIVAEGFKDERRRPPPDFLGTLTDGGEGGVQLSRNGKVGEADDGKIPRNLKARLAGHSA